MKTLILSILLFVKITSGLAQLNGGFENWTNYGLFQDPDNWQTNNFLSIYGNPLSAFRVSGTDKHSGNYALKITSIKITNKIIPQIPDSFGTVFNGKLITSPPSFVPGSPYTGRPEKLSLYAKYIPLVVDTALAKVVLYKGKPTGRDTIATGRLKITAIGTYSYFEMPLIYKSTLSPDSAQILFSVSESDSNTRRVGSSLYVDDVLFIGTVDVKEHGYYASKVKIFPNPAVDNLTVNAPFSEAETVELSNVFGQVLGRYKLCDYNVLINTVNYDVGCYFYRILNSENRLLTQGKFIIAK